MLLEIIQRLPHNESLRTWADGIMGLMLWLLRVENEDNGVVCIKIIIDHNRCVARPDPSVCSAGAGWAVSPRRPGRAARSSTCLHRH